MHKYEVSISLILGYPTLDRAKNGVFSTVGPQRPHHKRHNDVVAAVLQAGANQKRGDSHLRPSIARPQVLSMGAAGHYDPFTTLCIFQSLLNTPKNARWEVHHLSAAGSMPWFCPYRGIGAAQKAPAARSAQRGLPTCPRTIVGLTGRGPPNQVRQPGRSS